MPAVSPVAVKALSVTVCGVPLSTVTLYPVAPETASHVSATVENPDSAFRLAGASSLPCEASAVVAEALADQSESVAVRPATALTLALYLVSGVSLSSVQAVPSIFSTSAALLSSVPSAQQATV